MTETVPDGYHADGPIAQTAIVTAESTCGDGNEAAVSFSNTPLTDITVSVNSQIDGGTASTIECEDALSNVVASGSTGANGDGSLDVDNLEPTAPDATLVCTITVDP